MKIVDQIKDYFRGIQEYLQSEKELFKLRFYQKVGSLLGNVVSLIFIIILFHITLALVGIWLGIWLGDVLNSYPWGFGISALLFITLLGVIVIFRKALLIQPMIDMLIEAMVNEDKIVDEEKKEEIKKDGENKEG